MEISTAPRPAPASPWGRVLLCAVVLAPLVGFVLLPIGLGLQRHVMTGASTQGPGTGHIPRGSLLLERVVPTSDLRPGDVVALDAPAGSGRSGTVVHRIAAIGGEGPPVDPSAAPGDPLLRAGDATALPRVEVVLPGVGWLHLLLSSEVAWGLASGSALALGLLSSRGRRALATLALRRGRLNAAQ